MRPASNINQGLYKLPRLGVFKLRCRGKINYRLGYRPEDSRINLRRELIVKIDDIEILDEGKKQ